MLQRETMQKTWIALSISQKNCQDSHACLALHSLSCLTPSSFIPIPCMLQAAKMWGEGLRLGESDGHKVYLACSVAVTEGRQATCGPQVGLRHSSRHHNLPDCMTSSQCWNLHNLWGFSCSWLLYRVSFLLYLFHILHGFLHYFF